MDQINRGERALTAAAVVPRTLRVRGARLTGPIVLSLLAIDFADLVARAQEIYRLVEEADVVELVVNGIAIAQVLSLG